ncbi:MAG: helix-turn-helix domain-containing protein [Deltaproteobacteria bacterium]|nr:helix-turn-helix domain-containing protein [Deltaproteobacteria bacterium]
MNQKLLDIQTAAQLLGKTQRHIRRLCKTGQLAGAVQKGRRWLIPVSAHDKLRGIKTADDLTSPAQLRNFSEHKRTQALTRLGHIRQLEKFAAHFGGTYSDALAAYAELQGISSRSLQRWISRYRNQGLLGLIDGRGGARPGDEAFSPDAFELFKSLYLTPQQLSAKLCWQNINYINQSEDRGWQIPALPTVYKYVDRIPLAVKVLHREGLAAYDAKCAPYVQTDPESIQPGAVWIGDHHQFNCWIRHRGQ